MKSLLALFIVFSSLSVSVHAAELRRQTFLSNDFAVVNGKVSVAFFDADSTLRVSKSGSPSANSAEDYLILPFVATTIAKLNQQGYLVVIVSNQGGIPKFVTLENADRAIFNMIQDLKQQGANVQYYDLAENEDEFRKPGIGMGTRLEQKLKERFGANFELDKASSFMVGDSAYKREGKGKPADIRPDGRPGFNFSNSDRLFAENYGIRFFEPQKFFGWEDYAVELIESKAVLAELESRIQNSSFACSKIF